MPAEPTLIRLLMELRQQGITNKEVLAAIERVPREAFVPESFKDRAYENIALPIGFGQTISQPAVVAFMSQKIVPNRKAKILEIGTGSGYQAAILSKLFRRVYTIERYRELARSAEKRFRELRLNNIVPLWGDGTKGWAEQSPFDRIILTAGLEAIPSSLFDQLAVDGLIIAPVGQSNEEQKLVCYRKTIEGISSEDLWGVRFVPVVNGIVDFDQKAFRDEDRR